MDQHGQTLITKNLKMLIERTSCSSSLLAFLLSNEVIGSADAAELESIPNELNRSMKFYQIMKTKSNSFDILLNALRETKQTGALSILIGKENLHCKPVASKKCIRFEISHPVPNFSGRASELSELHEKMKGDKDTTNNKFHIVSVLGLGGIGKTQLCRSYANQYSDYFDGNLIWIDACREAAVANCFQRLAEHHLQLSTTGLDGKAKEAKTIVDEVYQSFADQKCLFIFDNADCVDYLQTFLPIRVLNPIHVLITSRNKEWDMAGNYVILNEMTESDATQFVKKELGIDFNDERQQEDINLLTNTLQHFPLALQQCISFIKQQSRVTNFGIADYVEMFHVNSKRLLNMKIPASIFGNYSETTFTTWKITTDIIQNDEEFGSLAIKILNIISYFETEFIPLQILQVLETNEEIFILSAVELLVKYSMVNSQTKTGTLSIHKLVQDVTKVHLQEQNNEVQTLRIALNLLHKSLCIVTVYHAVEAYFHAIQYKELVIEFSSLPWSIIFGFGQGYMYSHAKLFKNIALEQLHSHLPDNHIDILRTELHWGIVEFLYCNYEDCLMIFEGLHKRYSAQTPAANIDSDIAGVKHYIACTSLKLGKLTNSLSLAKESLEVCRKVRGINCRDTIASLQVVALNLEELGQYNEALSVYKQCIKLYKVNEGSKSSRDMLVTMQNKAQLYVKIGRLDKAFATALRILKKGPSNVYKRDVKLAGTGNILAQCFYLKRQYALSTRIAYEVYSLQKDVFGNDHVRTLNTLQLLANMKCGIHRSEDALLIHEYVYSTLKQRLGKFHELTLTAQSNVCTIYSIMGLHDEALEGFREILDILNETQVPNKHYNLAKAQIAFGEAQARMGNYNEALDIYVGVEITLLNKFGEKHYELKKLRKDIKFLRYKIRNSRKSNLFIGKMEQLTL